MNKLVLQKSAIYRRAFVVVAAFSLLASTALAAFSPVKLDTVHTKVANGKNGAGVDTRTYKGKLTIDRNDFGIGTDSIAAKISLEDEVEIKLLIVTFP